MFLLASYILPLHKNYFLNRYENTVLGCYLTVSTLKTKCLDLSGKQLR